MTTRPEQSTSSTSFPSSFSSSPQNHNFSPLPLRLDSPSTSNHQSPLSLFNPETSVPRRRASEVNVSSSKNADEGQAASKRERPSLPSLTKTESGINERGQAMGVVDHDDFEGPKGRGAIHGAVPILTSASCISFYISPYLTDEVGCEACRRGKWVLNRRGCHS